MHPVNCLLFLLTIAVPVVILIVGVYEILLFREGPPGEGLSRIFVFYG